METTYAQNAQYVDSDKDIEATSLDNIFVQTYQWKMDYRTTISQKGL